MKKYCWVKLRVILGITAAAFILELFVFNFRHWESLNNKELDGYQTVLGEGLSVQGDGSFLTGPGEKTITFSQIDQKLRTLYMDVNVLENGESVNQAVTLYQRATDDGNEQEYWIPDRDVWHSQKKSQYLTYHFYGNCKSLKLTLALGDGVSCRISYALNPQIPMFFSFGRLLAVWCLCVFVYLFRPASPVWRAGLFESGQVGKGLAVLFLALHILGAFLLVHVNPVFQYEGADSSGQYQKLAEAFQQGQLSLLDEPSELMLGMENPYDRFSREKLMQETGEWFYLWDHAYYDGKYYVYFGVVPELLFYFPYYLLTGGHLHNNLVIFLGAALFLAALMGVVWRILKRWFPKTSVGAWYLLSELLVFGSGIIYMCKRPDIYTVPIITGLAFGLLGFWCFLGAQRKDGALSVPHVACGSLFTALVAGCRPQLFLIAAFSVVFLKDYLFSPKYLLSKAGKRTAVALLLPMAAVAAGLMYYNAARFGSIFDFGANYNITMNDMRYRGFVPDRIPLGIWAYFFAPLEWKLTFPFVNANSFDTNYLGTTIFESTYGGIFAVGLFAWMCPALIVLRKQVKKDAPLYMAFSGMICALVIAVADAQMAGILMRYFGDIRLFVMLAAFLSWLLLFERAKGGNLEKPMMVFLVVSLLIALAYQGMIFFVDTGEALMDTRKDLFAAVKYQVMFWL